MVKHFILLVFLGLGLSFAVQGQEIRNIRSGGTNIEEPTGSLRSSINFAGDVVFGDFIGQSNDSDPDTIFLCAGDQLDVSVDNAVLDGDPDPSTEPGIAYVIYDCLPSITGPSLNDIASDPCLNQTDPIILNGNPVPLTGDFWLLIGAQNGDVTFNNQGQTQEAFAGGAPFGFFTAPITIDDFAGLVYETNPMDTVSGPNVNVNINDAFYIVYLNPIELIDTTTGIDASGCRGSFTVNGGLPQFLANERYDVSVELTSDPSVVGEVIGNIRPNESTEFFVPQPGIYEITVSDGKSCQLRFEIDMAGCTNVNLNVGLRNALPGDTVCVPVTVSNFRNIGSMEFRITWDESIIDFLRVENLNSSLAGFNTDAINPSEKPPVGIPDTLFVSWFDLSLMNSDLPDGAVLFDICFEVIGGFGSSSPVTVLEDPTQIEFIDVEATTEIGAVVNNGRITITSQVLSVNVDTIPPSCFDTTDGSITLRVDQGTPPYDISFRPVGDPNPPQDAGSINGAGQSLTIPNLGGGDYEITITDSNVPTNDTAFIVTIEAPPSIGVSLDATSPICNGDSTGTVTAEVTTDGVIVDPPTDFTFQWNIPGETGRSLSDVPAGPYAVTVTDADGCTSDASIGLSQPSEIIINAAPVSATCSGVADGSLQIEVNGGIPFSGGRYLFNSDEFGTDTLDVFDQSNLLPGEYCFTITDANGCTRERCFIVPASKVLAINGVIDSVRCNGESNGSIAATGTATLGTLIEPLTFTWSNFNPAAPPQDFDMGRGSRIEQLAAGIYFLTLSDSDPAGCQVVDTFVVGEPLPLSVTVDSVINETCETGNDGQIIVAVEGGTAPYTYSWSNGIVADSIATGLTQGDYRLTVTDFLGCTDSVEITIGAPAGPTILPISDDQIDCPGDSDGTLTVNANPINSPIASYQWSNGAMGPTITGLTAGTYTVTVTDEDGCVSIDSAQVIAPIPATIDSVQTVSPTCPGDVNGRIILFASGDNQPFTYTWDEGSGPNETANNVIPGLNAGFYNITITDANDCPSVSTIVTLDDPPSIDVTVDEITSTSCFTGTQDGSARATAIFSDSTSGIFNFEWSSGETAQGVDTAFATSLPPGINTLVVRDVNSCVTTDTFNVPSPPEIIVSTAIDPVSCNGADDGSVTLTANGGTAPFTYIWPQFGNQETPTQNDLPAGTFTAIIRDSNNCEREQEVVITEPARLVLSLDPARTRDVQCFGDNNGQIGVLVNENDTINDLGNAPFTWSNGAAPPDSDFADNLASGTYSVTVTDVRGCQDSIVDFTITEPAELVAVINQPMPPACFGDATFITIDTIFGGNGSNFLDYTYSVNNNGLSFPPDQPATIFAGTHIVTVEDPLGCTISDTLTVTQPDELSVIFNPDAVTVELGDSLLLEPVIINSLPLQETIWTPSNQLSDSSVLNPIIVPLDDQELTLSVIDVNGCDAVGSIFVEVDRNRNVFIPNVFSPNGDPENSEFRVFACTGVEMIESVQIFDRWGNMVYQSNGMPPVCEGGTVIWDGTFQGEVVDIGVYVYAIEVSFQDDVTLLYRGDIAVIR